jgi:hypothetical protein
MSRSVHTRPRRILAASRVRALYERRGHADPSAARAHARAAKGLGLSGDHAPLAPVPDSLVHQPRLHTRRAREGYHHPAGRADIAAVLALVGPEATYGLRSVELARRPDGERGGLILGRLIVPGRIVLYEQAVPPWLLAGRVPARDAGRLRAAGAEVAPTANGRTWVTWPPGALREFMLFDVLLHEVGHHVLQHHTGKRRVRIARTRDHEAFARAFADRYRRRYQEDGSPAW